MHNTNLHDYTISKQQQEKQHQYVKQTIATTAGNPIAEQASSCNIPQKIMGLLNRLGTDTTSVCLCTLVTWKKNPKQHTTPDGYHGTTISH